MNRADLQMVLGQADNLGDTMLRNRMLTQQKQERVDEITRQNLWRKEDNDFRDKQLKAQTDRNALADSFKRLGELSDGIKDGIKIIGEQARAKTAAGEDGETWARSQFDTALTSVPPEFAAQIKSQFKMFSDPGFKWGAIGMTKQPSDGDMTMTPVEGGRIAPNKTFIPDQLSPAEKYKLEDLKSQLSDARKRVATIEDAAPVTAENPTAENHATLTKLKKARKAVSDLEADVKSVLGRFGEQGGTKPTTPPQPDQPAPKPLDKAGALEFLKQANGDKNLAREMAKKAGYTF